MKIGLCLGGGGARGFAHIGVLKALEEHALEPRTITGCSMGGIIGALSAAGMTADAIKKAFAGTRKHRLLHAGRKGGLIGQDGIDRALRSHLPDTFADLKVPLAVTAVDVQEGRAVVLRSGDLVPALRATSAIPGIFPPVSHLDRMLVDGGMLNNVPVDVLNTLTLHPMVVVDVGAPPNRKLVFEDQRGFLEKLKSPTPDGQRLLTIELFMKAFDVPIAVITEMLLARHRPEVVIRPRLDPNLKLEDFDRMAEAAEVGYAAASEALTEAGF